MKKILAVLLIVGLLMAPITIADQVDDECTIESGEFSEEYTNAEGPDPAPCGGGESSGGGGIPG